ncbi:hypothetical protein [Rhizobium hidalgonense]|uniref:hypothetical protein n=1 Tax=Rhizobium hidalgonense TaxID=1538159 RepID=UPI002877E2B5|nr:hypothetical protein [Rhizobium hidalgonense]
MDWTDDDIENDRKIDLWHDGYFMFRRGEPRPTNDADMAAGWDEGKHASMVRPVRVERPEGYYHAPIGTFE